MRSKRHLKQLIEIGALQPVRTPGKPDGEGAFIARETVIGSAQFDDGARARVLIGAGVQWSGALYTVYMPFTEIQDGELLRINGELFTSLTPPPPLGTGGQGLHLELDVVRRRGNG